MINYKKYIFIGFLIVVVEFALVLLLTGGLNNDDHYDNDVARYSGSR